MSSNEYSFLFDSLSSKQPHSARTVHIRRLFDILHFCIHREDWDRAKRAWAILVRCKEVDWKMMWRTSLLLLDEGGLSPPKNQTYEDRARFLSIMMRQQPDEVRMYAGLEAHSSSHHGTHLSVARVHPERARAVPDTLWDAQTSYGGTGPVRQRARTSCSSMLTAVVFFSRYLPSYPYQDNPVLHTYAGLITLYVAQPSGDISEEQSHGPSPRTANQFTSVTLRTDWKRPTRHRSGLGH